MTPRILVQSSVGFLVSGVFAAALLAGPGPQYWNRPAAVSAPKAEAALKVEAPVAGKCDGRQTKCEKRDDSERSVWAVAVLQVIAPWSLGTLNA